MHLPVNSMILLLRLFMIHIREASEASDLLTVSELTNSWIRARCDSLLPNGFSSSTLVRDKYILSHRSL